jgi:DNA invertase Pin-like site-specific DNA recombinase
MQEIVKKELSRQETKELINNNLDEILDRIASGESYSSICKKYNINVANFCLYLNQDEIKEKKDLALQIASYKLVEKAEQELLAIDNEASKATIARQTHLYQHRIYLAKVKNRKELDLNYKEQLDINNNQQIIVIPANFSKEINNT